MQIKNNYDKEVFKGDIGTVSSINAGERTLVIRFDDQEIEYGVSEIDKVVLAYETTVHKAQDAEYPIVVIAGHDGAFRHAAEKSTVYRGDTCKKEAYTCRAEEGSWLLSSERNSRQTEHAAGGEAGGTNPDVSVKRRNRSNENECQCR